MLLLLLSRYQHCAYRLRGPYPSSQWQVFLVEAFRGNEALADSVNQVLVAGFYLINIGYLVLAVKGGVADSGRDALLQHPRLCEDEELVCFAAADIDKVFGMSAIG
jgi:hypothetical protein